MRRGRGEGGVRVSSDGGVRRERVMERSEREGDMCRCATYRE